VNKTALIVGASGIVGRNLAQHLLSRGWAVTGLARRPPSDIPGLLPCAADLLDATALRSAIKGFEADPGLHHHLDATGHRETKHRRQFSNGPQSARSRLIGGIGCPCGSGHRTEALPGPFEMYGKGAVPSTPFREDQDRLPVDNFYYAQEDEVFAAAQQQGFSWSVHRPHTIIGFALGNAMNMGVTLAV